MPADALVTVGRVREPKVFVVVVEDVGHARAHADAPKNATGVQPIVILFAFVAFVAFFAADVADEADVAGVAGAVRSRRGRSARDVPVIPVVVVVVVRVFVRVVEVLGTAEARLVVERARETEGRFPRGAQEPALGLRVHDGVFVLVFVDVDGEDGDRRRRGIFRVARRVIIVPRLLGSLVRRGDVVRERLGVDEHVAGVVVFRHRGQEGLGRRGTRGGVVLAALGDAQGRPSRHAGGFGGSRVSGRARLGRPDLGRRRARRRARRRIPAGSRSRGWRGYIGRG